MGSIRNSKGSRNFHKSERRAIHSETRANISFSTFWCKERGRGLFALGGHSVERKSVLQRGEVGLDKAGCMGLLGVLGNGKVISVGLAIGVRVRGLE